MHEHRMARYAPNVTSVAAVPAATKTDAARATTVSEPVEGGMHHFLTTGDEVLTSLRGIPRPEDVRNVVDSTGHITMPLIGQVHVAGMSASDAERVIERAYVDRGFYRGINVIMVSEDKSYFVQGEVGRQGRFRLAGEVTLLKAITEAGGYSPFASRRKVKIIRGDDVLFFNAHHIANGREPDPIIQANDIVVVMRRVFR
ncbi:MAG: polysaccharide biosynthesis/export family protein [Kiritimatiellia bacterium]